jgi:hypothetical protein
MAITRAVGMSSATGSMWGLSAAPSNVGTSLKANRTVVGIKCTSRYGESIRGCIGMPQLCEIILQTLPITNTSHTVAAKTDTPKNSGALAVMQYEFSNLLETSQYETDGLCDGIPVRKHIAEDLEEVGAFKAQEDWRKLVAPLSNYKGGLGPSHNFMAVSLPECLPERFEVVSYANEFAFLHDGILGIR